MPIWLAGASFVLFQFFLQLSSGVVLNNLMLEMQLTGLTGGLLSSAFYYIYTGMQIPVGVLFDKHDTRKLLAGSALLCSLSCFFFARSNTFSGLFAGRLAMGASSSFAFIGLSHLLREYFPVRQFAFMIGLTETLGFFITMAGMLSLGLLVSHWGWRIFIEAAGYIGLCITLACWLIIPGQTKPYHAPPIKTVPLRAIITSPVAWINGLSVGLAFTLITVFGAMWAIAFLQAKLNCSLEQASRVDAMLFLGAAVSCPLFATLNQHFQRKPLMVGSCFITALLVSCVLYLPLSMPVTALLMGLSGLTCGAYMLCYTIANEIAPPGALSTSTGFTNTLAMVTAPLLQPLIGYILDASNPQHGVHSLSSYQHALALIPLALCLSGILSLFLPEKNV